MNDTSDNALRSSKPSDEPKPPEALNAGRYAERLWGYKDQVGSHSEMGRLYERDRADFWYARFMEVTAVETRELLSIARDLSTMDCFWSASGQHNPDCGCLVGRAEKAVAVSAPAEKAAEPSVCKQCGGDYGSHTKDCALNRSEQCR